MTVPASNITFSNIQTEFGGSNPISLSEYYSFGTYVPKGMLTGSIPQSGAISVGNFASAKIPLNYITVGTTQELYKGSPTGYYFYGLTGTGSINNNVNTFYVGNYKGSDIYNTTYITTAYWYSTGILYLTLGNATYTTSYNTTGYTWDVGGTTFTSDSASKSYTSPYTYMSWSSITTNPYGTTDGKRVKSRFHSTSVGDSYGG